MGQSGNIDLRGKEVVLLRGRVTCEGRGVPYATLMLSGTSVGVSCNDVGEYELKLRHVGETDTVVVRSVGYETVKLPVWQLRRNGRVRLKAHLTELHEVCVRGYRNPRFLLQAAIDRIDSNYHCREAYSTFFYRDWRALDDELFLFDEAVMCLRRAGYQLFSGKKGYRFDTRRREMESNYKKLLRHRLVVYDRRQLQEVLDDPEGVNQLMEFDDNASFFDPVATPQASYAMARRVLGWHQFEPVQEFESDGMVYYRLLSVGPGNTPTTKIRYEWLIRKDNLAIVRHTATQIPKTDLSSDDAWVNVEMTHYHVARDSSAWVYGELDGAYTLTHYYNCIDMSLGVKPFRRDYRAKQHWKIVLEWTLTDFALEADTTQLGTDLQVRPQSLSDAFGSSDYNLGFWGHYNSMLLDTLPARLLRSKLQSIKR